MNGALGVNSVLFNFQDIFTLLDSGSEKIPYRTYGFVVDQESKSSLWESDVRHVGI